MHGTVDSSQRISGSDHESRYRRVYFLEVRDLLAGSLAYVAARTDELCSGRRNEVRVHLVAEQQERIGPRGLTVLEPFRIRPECVDLESLLVFGPRQRIGRTLGGPHSTRAEDESCLSLSFARPDHGAGPSVVRRPDELSVQAHVVRRHGSRLELVDEDERVVVALDIERSLAVPEDRHLCRTTGLDPHRRRRRARVPEQRSDEELVLRRGGRHGSRSYG